MKFSFETKDFIECDLNSDQLAVVGDDFTLTWQTFSQRVDSLCNQLKMIGAENLRYPVIIYGHKSANMLVSMYALMKMNITYIPIDVIYPAERLKKVISISKSQLILITSTDVLDLDSSILQIHLSTESKISIPSGVFQFEKKSLEADPLIYIIFTSGSTGEPKGVQISTEAVQSFVRWMCSDFGFSSADIFINTAILSFDLSVFEVMTFGALGATLVLTSKECASNPKLFVEHIDKNQGSVLVSTPSFILAYSRLKDNQHLSSLKTFLFCGEVLPHGTAKNLRTSFPFAKVLNTYGPTEATVATTLVEITDEVLAKFDSLPVGSSKPESELLIEEGEIVIVGPNVSMGYLNNPELNAAKFVTINGQRAFRTGDTGYLENNMLFFNGRNDDLVKLHGYRIELNEITAALNNLPYLVQGATIALKRDGLVKKIVSLVQLTDESQNKTVDEIKTDLGKIIPNYMIPSDIKFVDQIPLNSNGKADKALLTKIYLGEQ
jgi:D-alanine--poly(phosphoribitol) ligase subunit 1